MHCLAGTGDFRIGLLDSNGAGRVAGPGWAHTDPSYSGVDKALWVRYRCLRADADASAPSDSMATERDLAAAAGEFVTTETGLASVAASVGAYEALIRDGEDAVLPSAAAEDEVVAAR